MQFVPGSQCVVQSCQGLARLLLKFHRVYVPGIKVFEGNGDTERTNLSMGFALYDHRNGPTPEESQILVNLDALASFLRSTMMCCARSFVGAHRPPARKKSERFSNWGPTT